MKKLSNKELTQKYRPVVEASGVLQAKEVTCINHRPHMYMVGSKHIGYASDRHNGILDERTLETIPCAHPKCRTSYSGHTYDTVMLLKLKRNATNKEIQTVLKEAVDLGMEADGIDGFVFIKTEFDVIPEES